MGVMESRADRARRDAERVGDLGERVARVVMEHEDRSLVGRQPPEPTLQLVTVADPSRSSGAAGPSTGSTRRFDGPTTLARRLGDADVGDDAVDPRVEPIRIAEPPKVTPGDHQRVLEGILGSVDVAEDPVREGEEPVARRAHQVDECRLVATLRRLDEIPVASHRRSSHDVRRERRPTV